MSSEKPVDPNLDFIVLPRDIYGNVRIREKFKRGLKLAATAQGKPSLPGPSRKMPSILLI